MHFSDLILEKKVRHDVAPTWTPACTLKLRLGKRRGAFKTRGHSACPSAFSMCKLVSMLV